MPTCLRYPFTSQDHNCRNMYNLGGLPERPMGADCKSAGSAYEGSNPSPATNASVERRYEIIDDILLPISEIQISPLTT